MISDYHKCIFIHIPKTAGQSIERVFLDLNNLDWSSRSNLLLRYNPDLSKGPPRLAHLTASEYIEYNYISKENFNQYFKFAIVRDPWERIVSHYLYMVPDKKIDFYSFLKHIQKNINNIDYYWFLRPQRDFIFKEKELLVDYYGKFEELQNHFDYICHKLQISKYNLPWTNSSNLENDQPINTYPK